MPNTRDCAVATPDIIVVIIALSLVPLGALFGTKAVIAGVAALVLAWLIQE